MATLFCFPSILLTLCLCCCHQALNLAENNSCNNLFIVDKTFFINKEPVVVDTVATSQTVSSCRSIGLLRTRLSANFFTPANMTFAIAAEVGANLATFMPSRRLDFEDSDAADEVGSAAN